MATRPDPRGEIKLDPATLFLEEVFTDRRVGTIRRLTPVDGKGAPDPTRKIVYVGETQVMSNVGALPIVFEIDASSLAEAATKFGPLAKDAIEQTMREKLPEGFQRAEFLLEKGAIDMIVHRRNMRSEISGLIALLMKQPPVAAT